MSARILVALTCYLLYLEAGRASETLNFDNITTEGSFEIPDGYGGMQWGGEFHVVSSTHASGVFARGIVSPSYVAVFGSYASGIISNANQRFDFKSVYMTTGYGSSREVVTEGYRGNTLVYSATNTAGSSPYKFDFNWTSIDKLVFFPAGGGASYSDILIDDLVISMIYMSIYNAVEIGWTSVSGETYRVQYSTNLVSTNWFDIGDPVLSKGGTNFIFDSTRNKDKSFYRIIKE